MKISATNIIKKMNSLFKKSTIWFKVSILIILILIVFITINVSLPKRRIPTIKKIRTKKK